MSFSSWLQNLRSALAPGRGLRNHRRSAAGGRRAATYRPKLEALEDRRLLAFLAPLDYAAGAAPEAIVSADFNNDSALDLASANSNSNTVSVLLGNPGAPGFRPAQTSATGAGPDSVSVGDFNTDGKLDLATANHDGENVSVLLGNGDGTFQAPNNINIGSALSSVAVGDFNGDGLLDLGVISNVYYPGWTSTDPGGYEGSASVLLGNGNGGFSGPNVTSFIEYQWGYHDFAVAADLNGDGLDDFAMLNIDQRNVNVLLGDSSGYLLDSGGVSTGYVSLSVAAGDLDADGDADLVTANYFGNNVSVLLGNGLGGFTSGGNYATDDGPISIVLGDFTGDGKLDVATTNIFRDNLSVLSGAGDGALAPAVNFPVGLNPFGVAAGDFNGDGWLDAATANRSDSDVSVLINDRSWGAPLPPSASISDVTVTEGNTGAASAAFTLTLSNASNFDVMVHYATANITAAAGSDYTAASGSVIIPAGQTSRTFTVAVKGDRLVEPTETFAVNLSAPTNATIGDGQAIGTIVDNEPRISISDVTKAEGKLGKTTTFTFTVTLSAAYDQAVTLSYRTVNGTATTGDGDYTAKTGTLTFAPGQTTKTITINVKGDNKREANQTFYVDLFGNSSNSLFTKNRGIGTILNDD